MASSPAPGEASLAVSGFDAAGTAAMVEDVVREAVMGTAGNALGEYEAHSWIAMQAQRRALTSARATEVAAYLCTTATLRRSKNTCPPQTRIRTPPSYRSLSCIYIVTRACTLALYV